MLRVLVPPKGRSGVAEGCSALALPLVLDADDFEAPLGDDIDADPGATANGCRPREPEEVRLAVVVRPEREDFSLGVVRVEREDVNLGVVRTEREEVSLKVVVKAEDVSAVVLLATLAGAGWSRGAEVDDGTRVAPSAAFFLFSSFLMLLILRITAVVLRSMRYAFISSRNSRTGTCNLCR